MITALSAVAAQVALLVTALALRHERPRVVRPTTAHARTPRAPSRRAVRAHRRATDRAFPDAVELVVLAVRAGYLPAAAIAVVTPHLAMPIRAAFDEVSARCANGERFADALGSLPRRLGAIAAPLADSFAAADRYGQPLAPVLERLADEARQHRRRQADTLARQLPARMSLPLVLCTLPSFVLLAVVPLLLAALSSLNR